MKNYSAKDVDSYIASSPIEARPHLQALRKIVTSTIPKVEERISWGVPWYRYHGMLAGFAAYKNHVSFGPVWLTTLRRGDRKMLEKKGYTTGKKIIRIRFDQKVPATVIKQMLKAQAKSNVTKRAIK